MRDKSTRSTSPQSAPRARYATLPKPRAPYESTSLLTRDHAALALVVLVLRLSLCTGDRAEYAYVTRFGRATATLDGAKEDEAGLHLKWPWPIESVQRFDQRLQYFDLPGAELMTLDAKANTI